MMGKAAGTNAAFGYSHALKRSGIVWDEDSLHQWLQHPKCCLPGTKMVFDGLNRRADRKNLISFLVNNCSNFFWQLPLPDVDDHEEKKTRKKSKKDYKKKSQEFLRKKRELVEIMKLSTSIIAYLSLATEAQLPQKKSSKRAELTRYGWKWPKCRDIDNCGCGGKIGSGSVKSGVISVGEVDAANETIDKVPYGTKQTCMWHITVPKKHSIHMEFDRDYGFDVEYHNFCGFDKVHFFSGHYAPGQDVQRIARFCGPREGGQPWDGARKIYSDTSMPFWDMAYNSQSHKVTVAWDSDQTKNGMKGFKLRWWAVPEGERAADPCKKC